MGNTYSIHCIETKKKLWIAGKSYIYSGDPIVMDKLKRFLFEHRDKNLIFTLDGVDDNELDNCEEFE